jgi:iron complex outermembrane receptor protein
VRTHHTKRFELAAATSLGIALAVASAPRALAQASTTLDEISVQGLGERSLITGLASSRILSNGGSAERADGPVIGYRATQSATALKTDTAIRDTPQAVQVVPRQVIEDRQDTTATEALALAGVTSTGSPPGAGGIYRIRGIEIGRTYRDGVPYNGPRGVDNNLREIDTIGIERVEVLKGPPSVLYGRNEVGGLINIVSRRPSFIPGATVEGNVGSFDFRRFAGDVTGPVVGTDGLAFRLNGAYTAENSFIDFVKSETFSIRPSILWQPTADFRVWAIYEHEQQTGILPLYQVPFSGAINPKQFINSIPRSRYFGEPTDFYKVQDDRFRARAEWDFAPGWRSTTSFAASRIATDENATIARSVVDNNSAADRANLRTAKPFTDGSLYFDQNITGGVALGSTHMKLLLGYEHRRDTTDADYDISIVPSISIRNPQYGNRTPFFSFPTRTSQVFQGNAFYIQSQWYLTPDLILVGGLRYDVVDALTRDIVGLSQTDATYKALSPRAGIVYRPIAPLSLYFSWSGSFVPQLGTDANNRPFQPERGESYEVGTKVDWLPASLSSTFSLFDLTRTGVLTTDVTNPFFQIQTGEQRYRGFEASLEGTILPGWSVYAFYTFLDAKFTRDNSFPIGNTPLNVPDHAVSLWSNYTMQTGDLRGLQFGAGLFFVGSREADNANTFRIDPYVRVDASVSYTFTNGWRVALSGRNMLDERYFASVNGTSAYYGAPRTILLSASARF